LVVVFRNILVLVLLRGREEEIGAGVANKRKRLDGNNADITPRNLVDD
jgi:hypothetical protein